jgi:hypothetical protein
MGLTEPSPCSLRKADFKRRGAEGAEKWFEQFTKR